MTEQNNKSVMSKEDIKIMNEVCETDKEKRTFRLAWKCGYVTAYKECLDQLNQITERRNGNV